MLVNRPRANVLYRERGVPVSIPLACRGFERDTLKEAIDAANAWAAKLRADGAFVLVETGAGV